MSGRRALVIAFILALALAVSFAGHAVWVATRVAGEPPLVEDWMTPGLVMRTYGITPEALADAMRIAPGSAKGETLAEIAKAQGISVDELLGRVQAAIEAAAP
jgi:hypothetical protein